MVSDMEKVFTGERLWRVGEISSLTGMSVRTLRYYDEIGLLVPSLRSESGYRLYSTEDIRRLQEIKSLKSLGFALDDIELLLEDEDLSPVELVRDHIRRLDEEIARKQSLREKLKYLRSRLEDEEEVSAEDLMTTIKEMEMSENFEKYYTEEQLEYLARRREEVGEKRIKEVEAEWPVLIDEVRAEMERGTPPEDPKAQELARRWMGLVEEFTGGDPGIRQSLNTMYDDKEEQVSDMDVSGMKPMFEYIQRANEARS